MSKEALKNLIELVPDDEIDILYQLVIKFIPEVKPEPDEIEAIAKANQSILEYGTIPHSAINWD